MVMKMNKTDFIKQLSKELSYSEDKCLIINEILEKNFFISKKNKDKIIDELASTLDINYELATKIYDIAIMIINNEIKNKLKHPFKNKK